MISHGCTCIKYFYVPVFISETQPIGDYVVHIEKDANWIVTYRIHKGLTLFKNNDRKSQRGRE